MNKRVLIGGMHHESNTFNPIITGRNDVSILFDDEILTNKGQASLNGIMDTLLHKGFELVPTVYMRAVPNGIIDHKLYLWLKQELLRRLAAAGDIDGICLSLHGSMRVEGIGEAEGDLLEAIRSIAPNVPIMAALDMHASISNRMIAHATGFVGYKCAPHTDTYETGVHAADMLAHTLSKHVSPKFSICRIPALIAGEQSETSVEPMVSLMDQVKKMESRPGIMAANLFMGFPWADAKENCVTTMVVAETDQELADSATLSLAQAVLDRIDEFRFYHEALVPSQALDAALATIESLRPCIISDSGDNPTAGSSGDVTNFLKLVMSDPRIQSLEPPLVYQALYDPQSVELCKNLKIGTQIELSLGAKFDTVKSSPIRTTAEIIAKAHDFSSFNATLVLLKTSNVHIIIQDKHIGCYDPEAMRVLGLNPEECSIIVVKLGYLEPELRSLAKRSILALTDGSSNELLENLDYQHIERPMHPFDKLGPQQPQVIRGGSGNVDPPYEIGLELQSNS